MFMNTHLLPCRDLLYVRKHSNLANILPVDNIHRRWLLKNFCLFAPSPSRELGDGHFAVSSLVHASSVTTEADRYN